jgi:hypothetical protein
MIENLKVGDHVTHESLTGVDLQIVSIEGNTVLCYYFIGNDGIQKNIFFNLSELEKA